MICQNFSPHSPAALREPVAQPLLYENDKAALEGFGRLFSGLVMLRTHEASSPISEFEAVQLANSLCYVLGSSDLPPDSLKNALANDPFTFYVRQVKHLEVRVEALLVIWKRVCELMPASSQCFFARYVGKHRQDKDSIRYTFPGS